MRIIINYLASSIKHSDGMAEVPERDYGMSYRPAGTVKAAGGSNDGYAGLPSDVRPWRCNDHLREPVEQRDYQRVQTGGLHCLSRRNLGERLALC